MLLGLFLEETQVNNFDILCNVMHYLFEILLCYASTTLGMVKLKLILKSQSLWIC